MPSHWWRCYRGQVEGFIWVFWCAYDAQQTKSHSELPALKQTLWANALWTISSHRLVRMHPGLMVVVYLVCDWAQHHLDIVLPALCLTNTHSHILTSHCVIVCVRLQCWNLIREKLHFSFVFNMSRGWFPTDCCRASVIAWTSFLIKNFVGECCTVSMRWWLASPYGKALSTNPSLPAATVTKW